MHRSHRPHGRKPRAPQRARAGRFLVRISIFAWGPRGLPGGVDTRGAPAGPPELGSALLPVAPPKYPYTGPPPPLPVEKPPRPPSRPTATPPDHGPEIEGKPKLDEIHAPQRRSTTPRQASSPSRVDDSPAGRWGRPSAEGQAPNGVRRAERGDLLFAVKQRGADITGGRDPDALG